MSKQRIAVYPGSFDPPTRGHINIIERASRVVDKLVVGVLINASKSPMFTLDERVALLKEAVAYLPNVEVRAFSGLLVDFAKKQRAGIIIRGLRGVSDFESERDLANANRMLLPELETVFLMTDPSLSFISSSLVKEIASFGGDFSAMVPVNVKEAILNKTLKKENE